MKKFRLNVSTIELIECSDTSANGIVSTLCSCFENLGLILENIVGLSADTCNVMFGIHHSVSTLLLTKIPGLFMIKCSCHSIHECSEYASAHIPKIIEDVVRGICSQFSRSPIRRNTYKQFQALVECENHMPISPGQTRWLTMEYAVRRVVEQ